MSQQTPPEPLPPTGGPAAGHPGDEPLPPPARARRGGRTGVIMTVMVAAIVVVAAGVVAVMKLTGGGPTVGMCFEMSRDMKSMTEVACDDPAANQRVAAILEAGAECAPAQLKMTVEGEKVVCLDKM